MKSPSLKTPSVLPLARTAWKEGIDRDERFVHPSSEQRLAREWPKRRTRRSYLAPLALAAGLALGFFVSRRVADRTAFMAPQLRRAPQIADVHVDTRRPLSAPVALVDCEPCGIRAGAQISGAIHVPNGASLTLAWGFDDGLVDPRSRFVLTGPARASVEGLELTLLEGRGAAATPAERDMEVTANGSKIRGHDAEWTVVVHGADMKLSVKHGDVTVDGEPPPPEPPPAKPKGTSIPPPSEPMLDDAQAQRAIFHDAQVELAAGRVRLARGRLRALTTVAEPSLASDAWFLLARSYGDPQEQLTIWDEALAHPSSDASRAQARLERAHVLVRLGRIDEARAEARLLAASSSAPAPVRAGAASLLSNR